MKTFKAGKPNYIETSCNRKRRYSTLGGKSPAQFLQDWRLAWPQEKQVA